MKAVSLFAGAGGMDVGFRSAGFEVVLANEIDEAAAATYAQNHSGRMLCADIDDVFAQFSREKGVDVVFGGPPCQGFSVAGKMDPNDPRSRLIWRFMDMVANVRPRAFVCENVKALGAHARWDFIRRGLIKRASELGYETGLLVLNAADFGVPQARERMFLVGVRADCFDFERVALREVLLGGLEQRRKRAVKLGDVIRRMGPAGSEGNSRICNAKVTFAKSPVLRPSPYAGMMFNGAGRPLRANGVSATLPASMGGNKTPIVDEDEIFRGVPSYIEEYHRYLRAGGKPRKGDVPARLRRLTIDECAAIQTFPSLYKFFGPASSVYRQIGNAVPCLLAQSVAEIVAGLLSGKQSGLVGTQSKYEQEKSLSGLLFEAARPWPTVSMVDS